MTDATTQAAAAVLTREEKARTGGVWSLPAFSWTLFEFGRNPYYLLIVTYIFPPYFANALVGDPVKGQTLAAAILSWGGAVCALTAPILGAAMDHSGRRKPVLAFFVAALAISNIGLWWATPNALGVAGTMIVMAAGLCAYTYTEVMHNSMLSLTARPEALSRISGASYGLANLAGVLCLGAYIVVYSAPSMFGHPHAELQTLAPRALGPTLAVWMAIFVIPFFLFVPDGAPPGGSWSKALGSILNPRAAASFGNYVATTFREFPQATRFLVARMIYADGITAILSIGGVYTSGVLGWNGAEIGLYAIWTSVFAVIGGFLGGYLDRWFGARAAIITELTTLSIAAVLILSVTRDSIFFGLVPSDPHASPGELFPSTADHAYLGFVAILAIALTACLASSRYMLVTAAPKARISEFFGFYMISSTCTVWFGSTLIAIVTAVTQNQQLGMSSALLLVLVGLGMMIFTVKHAGRPGDGQGA
jgi:UMF1 family MFS transporter